MSDNPEDYELMHYGVKGMKWGVRKAIDLEKKRVAKTKEINSKIASKAKDAASKAASTVKSNPVYSVDNAKRRFSSQKKAARQTEDKETTSARERQVSRSVKVEKKQIEAVDAFLSGKQKLSNKLMDEAKNLHSEMLNHPDQKIANRMTTGEKRVRKINTAIAMTSIGLSAAAIARNR